MRTFGQSAIVVLTIFLCFPDRISTAQGYMTGGGSEKTDFQWPQGRKMGLSFTFDDARLTQIDNGIPLFDKYGVKATFYVSMENLVQRLEEWREAAGNGHEIGNHSLLHPCTVNYGWAPEAQLESFTIERMMTDLDSANTVIQKLLGIHPVSFAYPCGQTYVGIGVNTKSYVPVVASKFESGRLWLSERPVDPAHCDMSQLTGMELDGKSFEQIKILIDYAKERKGTGSFLPVTRSVRKGDRHHCFPQLKKYASML